jgi:chromosome segregation ATPase
MRKLSIIVVLFAVILSSCNEKQQKVDNELERQRDSLNQIIAQKDSEIDDLMATFNDIEQGFREINQAQERVSLARKGEGANDTERLRENIEFIQTTMKQNYELINKLRQQLRESSFKGEQLKKAIDNLTAQLEEKDRQLGEMRAELEAKDIHISELDQKIEGLNTNVSQLTEQNALKTETINKQDKELNSAWFVFGTKKELKEQNILVRGDVLRQNFNHDYFTKIDIRVDKEIKLYSRSAKILTVHPQSSYTLQRDVNKQYVLRINNPQQFWSTSKYLVVLVK